MELPNLSKFTNYICEDTLITYLLQNSNIDAITSRCQVDFFHNGFMREVFKVAFDYVIGAGRGEADFPAIVDILKHNPKVDSYAIGFLHQLQEQDARAIPAVDYAIETLEDLAKRRRLIMSTYKTLVDAQNPKNDVHETLLDLEEELSSIEKGADTQSELVKPEELPRRRYKGLMERHGTKGVFSGWDKFDDMLSVGFAPGKMSVVAGRTSMGKSFFKTNLIINMCENKVGVLNVCPEQGFDSEHDRIDAIKTGIHLQSIIRIREMALEDPKWDLLKKSSYEISNDWPYACVPTRSITVAGIRANIRRAKRSGVPIQVVFIDLFDRLADVNVAKDRTGTISVKLGQIERIAEEEKVHICLLVQVNRGPEGRKDKRPMLSDLRDCGNFEQDADIIFLLYREGYYNRDLEDNILDVEIAKQRDGVAGKIFQFLVSDKETLKVFPMGIKQTIEEDSTT